MRYLLVTHAPTDGWDGLAGWAPEDFRDMVRYMRTLDGELRQTGELVDDNGFSGPGHARTVITTGGTDPSVTDGLRPGARDFVVGYWLIDVADADRAVQIAARVSATPGPGGKPVDQPVEIHPVLPPPPEE